jgi:hypothetical protein
MVVEISLTMVPVTISASVFATIMAAVASKGRTKIHSKRTTKNENTKHAPLRLQGRRSITEQTAEATLYSPTSGRKNLFLETHVSISFLSLQHHALENLQLGRSLSFHSRNAQRLGQVQLQPWKAAQFLNECRRDAVKRFFGFHRILHLRAPRTSETHEFGREKNQARGPVL